MAMQKKLSATINIGAALGGSFGKTITGAKSGMAQIGGAIDQVRARQRELNAVMRDQERLGTAGSALKIGYASRELQALDLKIGRLRTIQGLEAKAQALSQKRAEIGASMRGTIVGAGVAAMPVIGAMKAGAESDYKVQQTVNTLGLSQKETASLKAQIGDTSRDMRVAVGEVLESFHTLAAAGVEVADARAMLRQVVGTAVAADAAGVDIGKAGATLVQTFGVLPKNIGQAFDAMTVAGKRGAFEMKAMAQYFPSLGSGASAIGLTGQEGVATIAAALQVARRTAGDDSEAANNLKNLQSKLLAPETLKRGKAMGLDLSKVMSDAVASGGNPFDAWIDAAAKATKGDQRRVNELLPDMQAQAAFRGLTQFRDEYKSIQQEARTANGVVAADLAANLASQKKQFDAIGQAAERTMLKIGGALNRAFGGTDGLAVRIDRIGDMIQKHEDLIGSAARVGAGLVALKLVVGTVGMAWTVLQSIVVGVRLAMVGVAAASTMAGTAAAAAGTMAKAGALGFAALGVAAKAAGVAAAGAFAAVEVFRLGSALKDLHGAKTREGVKLTAHTQRRIAAGELSGALPASKGGLGSGMAALPEPAMATAKGAGLVDNSVMTNHFSLTQAPGQDARKLADEVAREIEHRQAVKRRSAMHDGAGR